MRLFIGNLPFAATEDDLQSMFASAGVTPDNIQVMRDKFTGKSRGFGFAEVGDAVQGEKLVNSCNGQDLLGRALVVNEARPMAQGGGGGDRGPRRERGPRY